MQHWAGIHMRSMHTGTPAAPRLGTFEGDMTEYANIDSLTGLANIYLIHV